MEKRKRIIIIDWVFTILFFVLWNIIYFLSIPFYKQWLRIFNPNHSNVKLFFGKVTVSELLVSSVLYLLLFIGIFFIFKNFFKLKNSTSNKKSIIYFVLLMISIRLFFDFLISLVLIPANNYTMYYLISCLNEILFSVTVFIASSVFFKCNRLNISNHKRKVLFVFISVFSIIIITIVILGNFSIKTVSNAEISFILFIVLFLIDTLTNILLFSVLLIILEKKEPLNVNRRWITTFSRFLLISLSVVIIYFGKLIVFPYGSIFAIDNDFSESGLQQKVYIVRYKETPEKEQLYTDYYIDFERWKQR